MKVVSTHVDDGRLVIVVEKLGRTLYELDAAEIAPRADAVQVVTDTMMPPLREANSP